MTARVAVTKLNRKKNIVITSSVQDGENERRIECGNEGTVL